VASVLILTSSVPRKIVFSSRTPKHCNISIMSLATISQSSQSDARSLAFWPVVGFCGQKVKVLQYLDLNMNEYWFCLGDDHRRHRKVMRPGDCMAYLRLLLKHERPFLGFGSPESKAFLPLFRNYAAEARPPILLDETRIYVSCSSRLDGRT
jgi:hypothetical protein